jgi:hypothetical protein
VKYNLGLFDKIGQVNAAGRQADADKRLSGLPARPPRNALRFRDEADCCRLSQANRHGHRQQVLDGYSGFDSVQQQVV